MSIATHPIVEKPWSILYTKHCCTHVFARYRTRGDAETVLYRLRRIMPDCTLELIWNVE